MADNQHRGPHRPVYPQSAFTGPDSRITPAQREAMLKILDRISMKGLGVPANKVRSLQPGWDRYYIGSSFATVEIPPLVADSEGDAL